MAGWKACPTDMFDPIFTSFQTALVSGGSVEQPLDMLLAALRARAVGLWRCRHDHLEQVGFRAVLDMPEIVRRDFAAATQRVPLSEVGLGIVKAAVSGQPAIAKVVTTGGLGQSAGWLARFEARQSVAFPVTLKGVVIGVLASSSAEEIHEGDPGWQLISRLASEIGPYLKK